jgi:D-alanyl-D-alanine dipeptidase
MVMVWTILAMFLSARIPDTRQLIVVTSASWSANSGTLQRYEKRTRSWHAVGKPIAVKLGRKGLGWGRGLHAIPRGAHPIKREGDGKGVAGIFHLKHAFGYRPFAVRYPYKVYKTTDHCVDDVRSRYYNRIVDSTKAQHDYRSFEHMKFAKNYYQYGIVVDHNAFGTSRAKRGAGSCIFLHIKSRPTAGCTVMSMSQIMTLIRWLDPHKHPLLVQAPRSAMGRLKQAVGLSR